MWEMEEKPASSSCAFSSRSSSSARSPGIALLGGAFSVPLLSLVIRGLF